MTLENQLATLEEEVNGLDSAEPPPKTSLRLLGVTREEGAWQQYLAYFLDPVESHGLRASFVAEFIRHLQSQDILDTEGLPDQTHLLQDTDVDTEVTSEAGNRIDLVLSDRPAWYLCIELKVDASEGGGSRMQTERYAKDPDIVPGGTAAYDHGEYLYISPTNTPTSASRAFRDVDWETLLPIFDAVLVSRADHVPSATIAQLLDFRRTIATELTMTDIDDNTRHKKDLFFEYRETIQTVEQAVTPFVETILQEEWPTAVAEIIAGTQAANYEWQYHAVGKSYGQIRLPSWTTAKEEPLHLDIHLEHKPKENRFKNGHLDVLLELEEPNRGTMGKTSGPQYHALRDDLLDSIPEVIDSIDDTSWMRITPDPTESPKKLLHAEYRYTPGDEEGYYAQLAAALIDLHPVANLVSELLKTNDYTSLIDE